MKKLFTIFFLGACILLLLMAAEPAQAAMITREKSLGGISKALNEFYDRGGSFFDEHDLEILAAAMQLENGDNSDRCLLLTGSVILNRVYYTAWAPNTIEGVIRQGYKQEGCQQYATYTVENLYTVKVTDRVRLLAKTLLLGGPICPEKVIYQSMFKQGSGIYEKVDTDYFCYE